MDLKNKVALVTGGGGGIGAGIAEAFVEQGARVVITDIDLGFAKAEADRIGGDVLALHHDVASIESWARVKSTALGAFGAVDVLCNNAGVAQPFKPLDEVTPEEFGRIMAINVTGVYNGVRCFAPEMRARRSGHIVNTSSLNGLLSHATFAVYAASKFAVAGMSEALRVELEPFGVGVSILYPGLTRSRMSEAQMPGSDTQMAEIFRSGMMQPIWLGRAVVRAVENNELHIITHPGYAALIEQRFRAILDAHGEPAQPGFVNVSMRQD